MSWKGFVLAGLALHLACASLPPQINVPTARVTAALKPTRGPLPALNGHAQPVVTFRDMSGLESDFVEGFVLVNPGSPAELQRLLARYGSED